MSEYQNQVIEGRFIDISHLHTYIVVNTRSDSPLACRASVFLSMLISARLKLRALQTSNLDLQ